MWQAINNSQNSTGKLHISNFALKSGKMSNNCRLYEVKLIELCWRDWIDPWDIRCPSDQQPACIKMETTNLTIKHCLMKCSQWRDK